VLCSAFRHGIFVVLIHARGKGRRVGRRFQAGPGRVEPVAGRGAGDASPVHADHAADIWATSLCVRCCRFCRRGKNQSVISAPSSLHRPTDSASNPRGRERVASEWTGPGQGARTKARPSPCGSRIRSGPTTASQGRCGSGTGEPYHPCLEPELERVVRKGDPPRHLQVHNPGSCFWFLQFRGVRENQPAQHGCRFLTKVEQKTDYFVPAFSF